MANYKMAKKTQQYSKQIMARTAALKGLQEDDRRLLEEDLGSFPIDMDNVSVDVDESTLKVGRCSLPVSKVPNTS
jgi:hypothetical protein